MTSKSDKINVIESKQFKKNIVTEIKKKNYNLENTRLNDNYLFFKKIYLDLIAFYINCDDSITFIDFLESHKDATFIFNMGFRATSFKVRQNFDIYVSDNDGNNHTITFESWNGRIVSSSINIPSNIYDVFMLRMYLSNNPEFASKYDWTPLDRVFETHFIDIRVCDCIISSATTYLSKLNNKKDIKLYTDWSAYKRSISEKQCDDYDQFAREIATKKEEQRLNLEKKN